MKYLIILTGLMFLSPYGKAQSLQGYIAEAQANNPGIRSFEMKYQISKEKVNEASWLPNTEFGIGYFVLEPETRTGAQKARFSGRQMLPWFGTIGARENLANSMSQADYLDWVIAKRRIALEVAQSYYTLFGLRAKQKVLQANIELLRTYEELALKAVEVSKASAVDVLRLQIRQNELQQRIRVLQEEDVAAKVKFNSLLNRPLEEAVVVLEDLSLPDSDLVEEDSLQVNPELLRLDALYESVAQEELLNQKNQNPMFGLGLDYIPVQERGDMAIVDNGKDIIMPMISLSVPIFNAQYKSRSKQNEMRQQEIQYQRQERYNTLNAALNRAIAKRNESRIVYDTQLENLHRARDAEGLLVKSYETGTIDFDDILDIQEIQLRIQIDQINAIAS